MSDVLFVCVHNAGRSQMAAAIFNDLAAARRLPYTAASAGTAPGESVHPVAAEAMREIGIDISRATPLLLTDAMVQRARRVITLGCAVDAGACPALSLKKVADWGLPDPKGKPIAGVRLIRDDIRRRVHALLDDLTAR
ncbi:MAG: arsenate reductase ArsC [Dehalococcoidia bacterium]|nr:arsenate reductase ArsC [Dehalococcoidia bacterium]